jgi:hypothetical protein
MRKLPFLLFAMLLLGGLGAAADCPTTSRPTDEELFARASTVFLAHIVRTEEVEFQAQVPGSAGTRGTPALEATFRLVEVR